MFASAEACLAAGLSADCAILDVTLPGRSGLDLHAALAARPAGPPVVFISARSDVEVLAAVQRTQQPLVRKPLDEHELLGAIARVAGR